MTDDNPLLLHSTQEKSSELTEDELETDSSSSRYGRGVHLQDKQALECMEEGIKHCSGLRNAQLKRAMNLFRKYHKS